jgi:MtN3 and saliva related transmembrane protein
MEVITMIGLAAGFCTTIAFLPQAIKTWQTKSAKDLSLGMYSILCTGILLWLIYGFLIGDIPIILANGVTLALALSILYFKLTYKD